MGLGVRNRTRQARVQPGESSSIAKRTLVGILSAVLLAEQLQIAVEAKYHIVRELTRGGMSRVFLARDIKLERDVAIKVLSP
ncbi:MAG TPA: hypothetical protein VF483_00320, partial [Gemmatimonadaceae bacterium]